MASDIPSALMMRWITWIRLFDFEIKHIPGSKNAVADALSRKPLGPTNQREKETKGDINDWVNVQIFVNYMDSSPNYTLANGYSDHSYAIAKYVITL